MIGIIPAAGAGQRIQPLGCSKELLPVGSRHVDGVERPRAVSEYLVERMIAAGAEQICMVISGEKTDLVRYYAERDYAAEIFYAVQRRPRGLCDAIFQAEPAATSRCSSGFRTRFGSRRTPFFPAWIWTKRSLICCCFPWLIPRCLIRWCVTSRDTCAKYRSRKKMPSPTGCGERLRAEESHCAGLGFCGSRAIGQTNIWAIC